MNLKKEILKLNSFKEFNKMQKDFLKKNWEKKNQLIAAPTSSGKTLLCELTALNSIINNKKKVIYTCPLKALASEHFTEFNKKYSKPLKVKIALSTGDFDSSSKYLSNYDWILMTTEKLDSIIRHNASWLSSVGLLIVDEIHEIDSGRGPTIEMVIAKLKALNPELQIIAMSATVPNAEELSNWLNAELIKSDFRPVKLEKGIFLNNEIKFLDNQTQELSPKEEPIPTIVSDTLEKQKQCLISVNSRKRSSSLAKKLSPLTDSSLSKKEKTSLNSTAEKILSTLESPTEQCKELAFCIKKGIAFHNAGVVRKQLQLIEDAFRERKIKAIVATPTIFTGINLPAFRVIMSSVHRYTELGMTPLTVREVNQALGRCVTGDTFIFNEKGEPSNVEDIASKHFKKNETGRKKVKSRYILSIDLKTRKVVSSKLKFIWKRKTKKLFKINTKGGKEIKVTKEHPLLTFTKIDCGKARISKVFDNREDLYKKVMKLKSRGFNFCEIKKKLDLSINARKAEHWFYEDCKPRKKTFEWKAANKLKKGQSHKNTDYLSSALGFGSFDYSDSPRKYLDMHKLVQLNKKTFMTKQGHTKCNFPNEWDSYLVRFIAKIMSDGSIYYDNKDNSYLIRYYNKNEDVHKEYAKMCFELFGKKLLYKWRRGSYCSGFKSYLVGNFLENIGVPSGKKSFKLILPKPLWNLPKSLVKDFIREYVFCDGWEEKSSYCMITSSKRLAYDLALLISKIGYMPRVNKAGPNNFRDKDIWITSVSKSQFDNGKKIGSVGNLYPDLIKSIEEINEDSFVYDLTLNKNHNFIANGLIVHNSGRPQYDSSGEGILIAKSKPEYDDLLMNYLFASEEHVHSQLGIEPILRTHLLALISSKFVYDFPSLKDFFSKTFYCFQFQDISQLMEKLEELVSELEEMNFIETQKGNFSATPLGRRVSELYLDPLSAHKLLSGLEKELTPLGSLFLLINTSEFSPYFSLPKKSEQETFLKMLEQKHELPIDIDQEQFFDTQLTQKFNSTLLLNDWLEEKPEQSLLKEYSVQPGILHSKLQITDWLCYAALELSRFQENPKNTPLLVKLRKRLKYGIKEELLELTELKFIGRVRARKLFKAKITSISAIKKAPLFDLSKILGAKTAEAIKSQLGQKQSLSKKEKSQLKLKSEQSSLNSF